MADAVLLPAREPALDRGHRRRQIARLAAEPAHDVGIRHELEHVRSVLEPRFPQQEPLGFKQAAP